MYTFVFFTEYQIFLETGIKALCHTAFYYALRSCVSIWKCEHGEALIVDSKMKF